MNVKPIRSLSERKNASQNRQLKGVGQGKTQPNQRCREVSEPVLRPAAWARLAADAGKWPERPKKL
jgi:hypothetical protein